MLAPFPLNRTIEAFRQGLRELGYVEGENIIIEYRYAEGKFDRLPALAAELVRLKVDIIITGGEPATRAAKEATATIPIVTAQVGDPVGSGLVASLAQPGGNITRSSTCPGAKRKTIGTFEGDHSRDLPRGGLRDFDPDGQRTVVKRRGARRKVFRSKASIPGRTGSHGY
jgi:ABC transporter substrate binding protein